MPEMSKTDIDLTALIERRTQCEEEVLGIPPPSDGGVYCDAVWDGWGCWNHTRSDGRAFIACPSFVAGFDPSLLAYRDCNADGTWWLNPQNKTWSNYTACINIAELTNNTRLVYVYITGYSLSILAMLASLFIFVYFRRQLQCERVTLHKHLFTSYVLNGLAWILYYTQAALSAAVLADNPVWCRALHVVTQYFVTCNFFWMFGEGLYLRTLIVQAFASTRRLLIICYVIGWGVPVLTTGMYTAVRANYQVDSNWCWVRESHTQWIISGPIIITVAMNLFFLCDILRVLVTKLRVVNSADTVQTKKAVRAALILIPLLGLQYILFPMKPQEGSQLEALHLTTVAIVTSLQGVFVAVLFCFCNGEVISVIRRQWQQDHSFPKSTTSTCHISTTANHRQLSASGQPSTAGTVNGNLHSQWSEDHASFNRRPMGGSSPVTRVDSVSADEQQQLQLQSSLTSV